MLKAYLVQYQLLEDCLACTSMNELHTKILNKIDWYRRDAKHFVFDWEKAKQEQEALARQKEQEGKWKAYKACMMHKAKWEGKDDVGYYLHVGAAIPTLEMVHKLRQMTNDKNDRS